jgi:hypothetical protein
MLLLVRLQLLLQQYLQQYRLMIYLLGNEFFGRVAL